MFVRDYKDLEWHLTKDDYLCGLAPVGRLALSRGINDIYIFFFCQTKKTFNGT